MDQGLRERLDRILERHEELGAAVCRPEVVADTNLFRKLSRELAELDPVAAAWAELSEVERELASTRALADDRGDPEVAAMAAAELRPLEARRSTLQATLADHLAPRDPHDVRNVILEIRAGTGGEEAALFAADLWRMYSRFAERQRWTVIPLSVSEASAGGLKEVTARIEGRGAFGTLRHERGVHRVQRVPATEAQGRIHTSTATVAVLPEAEEVDVQIAPSELRIDVMRSSGAGGQHVNTTDSAVRITHLPTGLAVHSQQERSQIKNREIAMALLRSRLLDLEVQRADSERASERREQIGTGERSEKVRTYNYPQDRVTDHRIGLTRHDLPGFMDGDLSDTIAALKADAEARRLAADR